MIETISNEGLKIDTAFMTTAIDAVLLELLDEVAEMLLSTYHNWDEKPDWKKIGPRTVNGNRELIYQTDSTPYVWVDEGTDGPYTITAKNSSFLSFRPDSRPRTVPGSMMSTAGFPGSIWRRAQSVQHPGIDARDFTDTAALKLDRGGKAAARIQAAIDKEVEHWL